MNSTVFLGGARCIGITLPIDSSGKRYRSIAEHLILYDLQEASIQVGEPRTKSFRERLERSSLVENLYFSLYRFALSLKDSTAQYLALYSLLLNICEDNQRKVDDLVLRIQPGAQSTVTLSPRGIMETIFTRIRNEISHVRTGVIPQETREEIQNNLGAIRAITKIAIKQDLAD